MGLSKPDINRFEHHRKDTHLFTLIESTDLGGATPLDTPVSWKIKSRKAHGEKQ
jgi:hypothetical protein